MFSLENIKKNFFSGDRIVNSYLISGEKEMAIAFSKKFAQVVFSMDGAFVESKRIENESHPDLVMIRPKDGKYTISQARGIVSSAYDAPYEGKRKIYIIEDFDKFLPLAQNSLLKVLEEPPRKTVFLILSNEKDKILPTIISRTLEVKIPPISYEYYKGFFSDYKIEENKLKYLFLYSGKSISFSREILNRKNFFDFKNQIVEEFSSYLKGNKLSLFKIADLYEDKEDAHMLSSILSFFLRDLAVFKVDPAQIFDLDSLNLYKDLESLELNIKEKIINLEEIRRHISSNVNTRNVIISLL